MASNLSSGPPPKPEGQRRRRNAAPQTRKLPRAGRSGKAPAWPLPVKPSPNEVAAWRALWRSPQAVAWEQDGAERVVAHFVRAEDAALTNLDWAKEARQLGDRLGLSPLSMLRLRWEIVDDAEVASTATDTEKQERRRLRVVDEAV